MIYVLACCQACAEVVARDAGIGYSRWQSVNSAETLRGLRNVEVLCCTNLSSRRDYNELYEELNVRGITCRVIVHNGFKQEGVQNAT